MKRNKNIKEDATWLCRCIYKCDVEINDQLEHLLNLKKKKKVLDPDNSTTFFDNEINIVEKNIETLLNDKKVYKLFLDSILEKKNHV